MVLTQQVVQNDNKIEFIIEQHGKNSGMTLYSVIRTRHNNTGMDDLKKSYRCHNSSLEKLYNAKLSMF